MSSDQNGNCLPYNPDWFRFWDPSLMAFGCLNTVTVYNQGESGFLPKKPLPSDWKFVLVLFQGHKGPSKPWTMLQF